MMTAWEVFALAIVLPLSVLGIAKLIDTTYTGKDI